MAKIEGIRVKNFKTLKDVTLGEMWDTPDAEPLTPMTVVIGKNGVGKSTLFDVFGFLADALKFGVEEACDMRGRGGFEKIRSQEENQPINISICFSQDSNKGSFLYDISIDNSNLGRCFVEQEVLCRLPSKNNPLIIYLALCQGIGFTIDQESFNKPYDDNIRFSPDEFISLSKHLIYEINVVKKPGEGVALDKINLDKINEAATNMGIENIQAILLDDNKKLGIAALGALKQHPEISLLRQFMESWYLSYFSPDAARTLPMSGTHHHLNSRGDNLANVVQFMEREHRDKFQNILNRIAEKIPGICSIKTYRDPISNQLHLLFQNKGFDKPFYAPQMSNGTLKVFAYLLLLEDPNPPPFICIEEPENGLYHKLLETLAAEFRSHATGKDGGSQLFITTHQPYFVDALEPEEVWILEKGEDGFATIRRASDDELVKDMVAEGLPLGGLWYSDYLDAR